MKTADDALRLGWDPLAFAVIAAIVAFFTAAMARTAHLDNDDQWKAWVLAWAGGVAAVAVAPSFMLGGVERALEAAAEAAKGPGGLPSSEIDFAATVAIGFFVAYGPLGALALAIGTGIGLLVAEPSKKPN